MHKIIAEQQDSSNIIHHINSNEFDNRLQNLIEITISPEEKTFMQKEMKSRTSNPEYKYTQVVKHQYIHRILNFIYPGRFFNNSVDLAYFDENNSFYKVFLNKHINNPEKMLYEYVNSTDVTSIYDSQKLINHIITEFERK